MCRADQRAVGTEAMTVRTISRRYLFISASSAPQPRHVFDHTFDGPVSTRHSPNERHTSNRFPRHLSAPDAPGSGTWLDDEQRWSKFIVRVEIHLKSPLSLTYSGLLGLV